MDIPIGQQLIALLRVRTSLAEAVELLMLEGLDPWGEGESQEMQRAKDHFAIAMAIGGVNVTFDDIVVHEPINDIRCFAFGGADDLVMPQEVPLIDEGIGTDTSILPEILEGIVGIEGFDGHPVFLAITGGMQLPGVAPVDLWEFQLVHERQEAVVGGLQVLQRKVPIDGGLQVRGVDPFGNPGEFANANEASIADDACQKCLFRWPGSSIFDVPRLKGLKKTRETIDRREDFDQGDIVLIGEEMAQRIVVLGLGLGRGEVELAVLVTMEMRVSLLDDVLIGRLILLIKPCGQRLQRLLAVGDRTGKITAHEAHGRPLVPPFGKVGGPLDDPGEQG